MERCICWLVGVTLLLLICGEGQGLDEGLLPSGVLRDDILFDISWPGLPATDAESKSPPPESQQGGEKDQAAEKDGSREVGKVKRRVVLPNSLFSESGYSEESAMDIRTGSNEQYHCILPEIHTWEANEVGVAGGGSYAHHV